MLPVLQVCFLLSLDTLQVNPPPQQHRIPGYWSFCCNISFKSGSVLQLRLHFKGVSVNPCRRLPGTKQSLIFRHSAVSSHPKSISAPGPSPGPCTGQLGCVRHRCKSRAAQKKAAGGPSRAALQGDTCTVQTYFGRSSLQLLKFCFCAIAGPATRAPSPPGFCSLQ